MFLVSFSATDSILQMFSCGFLSMYFITLSSVTLTAALCSLCESDIIRKSSVECGIVNIILPHFVP